MTAPSVKVPRFTDLAGMPFLDDGFRWKTLLAMIAAARRQYATTRGQAGGLTTRDAEAWLTPARAYMLNAGSTPMPSMALTSHRRQQLTETLSRLSAAVPSWAPLLRLPVRFALLHPANGAISASSRDWPQHVLLAPDAFATPGELDEQVLHELAHQWLYLIEDIWPLDKPAASRLTLPSGTKGRSPAEVLGAAHVAAALIRLYKTRGTPDATVRARDLVRYGTGCLDLAQFASHDLTDAGNRFIERLKEEL